MIHDETDPPYITLNLKNHLFIFILLPVLCSTLFFGGAGFQYRLQDLQEKFQSQGEVIQLYFKTLGDQVLANHQAIMHPTGNTSTQGHAQENPSSELHSILQSHKVLDKFSADLFEKEFVRSVHVYLTGLNNNSHNINPSSQDKKRNNNEKNKTTIIQFGPRIKPNNSSHYFSTFFSDTQKFVSVLESNTTSQYQIVLEFELDRRQVLISQRNILLLYLFASFVIIILSAIFAYYIANRFIDPIRAISFAISRIREGRLSTRVNNRAPTGELNELTWGINSMAESLQSAHVEMQHNIDQATQDLRDTLETIEIQNIELEFSRKEAENANRTKSKFLANISHEVRTPLNSIIGFTNLLMKSDLNPNQRDQLQTIYKSSENLLAIINDILDFSKIEAGKLSLNIDVVDIKKILHEISEILNPLAKEQKLKQILIIDDNVPDTFLSDSLRVKQVLTNLVNNAIKFSDHGSLIIRVSIENYKSEQAQIKFSVADEGMGLNEDAKSKLFDAFHQNDSSNIKRFQGTGLGLTISRQLVEMLGGEIGVESTLGKGSVFWFTLPADKAENASSDESHLHDLKTTSETQTAQSMLPKILAVDDNLANLKLLCALLDDLKADYDACSSGREAIVLSKENDYDLILMDIQMPNLDGIETTRKIREFDKRFVKQRAIVALTAYALEEEKQNILKSGFNDCLTKPIDMQALTTTVEHWTGYSINTIKRELPEKKTAENNNAIDTTEGLRLAGGKYDLAEEMLDMLIGGLKEDWQRIQVYAQQKNHTLLLEKVHYLHGATRYCGVPRLQQAIAKLEKQLKTKQNDFKEELQQLEREIDQILSDYHSLDKPIYHQ